MTSRRPDPGTRQPLDRPGLPRWWWLPMILLLVWFALPTFMADDQARSIAYSRFLEQVRAGNVEQVTIQGEQITGDFAAPVEIEIEGETVEAEAFQTVFPGTVGDDDLMGLLESEDVTVEVEPSEGSFIQLLFVNLLPFVLLGLLLFWLFRSASRRQEGIFQFGQSKARQFKSSGEDVTFDDVAGQENAKTELAEIVDFLKDPDKYTRIGAKLPRGVLLVGPPGTGKTLLARAVAGEAGVPFFNLSATEFVEMFVGVGASRVRDLFEKAKAEQPSIVFIDELDAIGRRRGAGVGQAHDEREQTLNQLLEQLDGFEERTKVVVLAATNRPDVLDPALLRPGRFDREVTAGLPDRREREAVLEIHTRRLSLADDVDLETVAKATIGMSGADLANLANEAALIAARHGREEVEASDFDSAIDKVILGGPEKPPMGDEQRRLVAFHESGHALVAWFTPGADPVRKVTIVPHGRAGGATSQLPEEDRRIFSRSYLLARIRVLLGGRIAEEVALDEISTGAEADLVQATRLVRRMVSRWGMGTMGVIAYHTEDERPFLGYQLARDKEISEETAARIDQDVERLLAEQREQVAKLLSDHRDDLDRLVERLMEDETLSDRELQDVLGPRGGE